MKPFLLALCAGLIGGAAGALGVHFLARSPASAPSGAGDDAALRDVREALASLERRLDRPGLATTDAPAPAPTAGPGAAGAGARSEPGGAGHRSPDGRVALSAEEIQRIASEAADAALEKRAAKEKEIAKAEERKKATLAEASRELGLSAAQENDLRAAYADATEKYLKVFAEPEQTPDELRRELEAVKGDPAKKTALTMKYLPKMMSKLGDVMAIETEKDARVRKAVGPEKLSAYKKFKIAEEDPFGLDGLEGEDSDISIGVSTGG